MDTSQQYINMCRGLHNTDELRVWQVGDYYAENIYRTWYVDVFTGYKYYSGATDGSPFKDWIWLPRQDQLQVMLGWKQSGGGYNINFYIQSIAAFSKNYDNAYSMGSSFEQLWLAFVMMKLWKKQWDGKEWKKIE